MEDNLNTVDMLLIVSTAILLIFWLIWVVRLIICRHKLKGRNALLFKRYEDIRLERKKSAMLEELLDSYDAAGDGISEQRRRFHKLEQQVIQTRIYKNVKVSEEDLAIQVGMDKQSFRDMFKDACPQMSAGEWVDGIRLNEAIAKLRAMKAEKSEVKPSEEEKEQKIAHIAEDCGFSGRRSLNSACKRLIGISLHELLRQL